jgi:hypothetical protein
MLRLLCDLKAWLHSSCAFCMWGSAARGTTTRAVILRAPCVSARRSLANPTLSMQGTDASVQTHPACIGGMACRPSHSRGVSKIASCGTRGSQVASPSWSHCARSRMATRCVPGIGANAFGHQGMLRYARRSSDRKDHLGPPLTEQGTEDLSSNRRSPWRWYPLPVSTSSPVSPSL